MITFNSINDNTYNQEIYNNDIHNLNLDNVKCTCGSIGNFFYHASYKRYLVLDNGEIQLTITRVKCRSCNKTHALLPNIIIPYRIISNPIIIKLIQSYCDVSNSVTVISKITGLSVECVRTLLHFFEKYHRERMNIIIDFFGGINISTVSFQNLFFKENNIMFMQRILTKNHLLV